jgi:tetratricopeptide (TPR) repeat protein
MPEYVADDGRRLTLEDLYGPPPQEPGSPTAEAIRLWELGRAAGSIGQYAMAAERFNEAIREAPDWPQAVYDLAFTWLYAGDNVRAKAALEHVLTMVDTDFRATRTTLDTLAREADGRAQEGLTAALVIVEAEGDPSRKRLVLEAMAQNCPEVPRVWQLLAAMYRGDKALAAVDRALAADPDPVTHAMLVIQQAWSRSRVGRRDEAVTALAELLLGEEVSPVATRSAKWTLRRIWEAERAASEA